MSFRWVAGLFTILAFAVLGGAIYQVIFGFKPEVAVQREEGPFFRVDVKLDYKGKPHDISYVAACNAKVTFYADNSTTREVGVVPNMYGHRMDDGQAVVIETPGACSGETTANQWVPENYIPLIVVYENARTLDFGRAYMTEDAYDSPLAELKVHKASIFEATRAEFDDFAKAGPKNIVTRERFHSDVWHTPAFQERAGVKQVYDEIFGNTCHVAVRYRLSEEKRVHLRHQAEYLPNTSWTTRESTQKLSFWSVGTYSNDKDLLQHRSTLVNVGGRMGIMRHSRDSMIGDPKFRKYKPNETMFPTLYPIDTSIRANRMGTKRLAAIWAKEIPEKAGFIAWNVEMEPVKRGFGYCYSDGLYQFPENFNQRPILAENGKIVENDDLKGPLVSSYFQGDTFLVDVGSSSGMRAPGGDVL
jgi:hypothetical protein